MGAYVSQRGHRSGWLKRSDDGSLLAWGGVRTLRALGPGGLRGDRVGSWAGVRMSHLLRRLAVRMRDETFLAFLSMVLCGVLILGSVVVLTVLWRAIGVE